jgi:hypothetical protein
MDLLLAWCGAGGAEAEVAYELYTQALAARVASAAAVRALEDFPYPEGGRLGAKACVGGPMREGEGAGEEEEPP